MLAQWCLDGGELSRQGGLRVVKDAMLLKEVYLSGLEPSYLDSKKDPWPMDGTQSSQAVT